ncbi:MAG: M23 family metallopeptidase [Myxococcota bacterium]|nr:M23 family metallopeptidase [Myxococcota bacterium]
MIFLLFACSSMHMKMPGPLSGVGRDTIPYRTRFRKQLSQEQGDFAAQEENRFLYPLQGRLSSKFGPRVHPISKKKKMHKGIDLAAARGTPIRAIHKGTVSFAGERGGLGNLVIIDHGKNIQSYYAHCHELKVKTGQRVDHKTIIATVGSTGYSTGPHLHLEIRKNGTPIDPLTLLKK